MNSHPRDLLLNRHRAMAPRLDTIRCQVIQAELGEPHAICDRPRPSVPWWRAWLWPHPVAWGALAALWLVIAGLHLTTGIPEAMRPTAAIRPEPHLVAALQQQRQMLAELLGLAPPAATAGSRLPIPPPPPRSERRPHFIHA